MAEHRLTYSRAAAKEIDKLPPKLALRVVDAIGELASQPRPPGCKKLSAEDDFWRIRVGDYRVIYEIDDDRREILVTRVRHRREIYRD